MGLPVLTNRYAIEPAVKILFLTLDEARQEPQSEILIAASNFRGAGPCINYFLTNREEPIEPIAVNKFGVFMSGIGFKDCFPGRRRELETVVNFLVCVELLRQRSLRHQSDQNQGKSENPSH
jgi:hypothetical protein